MNVEELAASYQAGPPPAAGCILGGRRQEICLRDFETKPVPSEIDKEALIRMMGRALREQDELIEKLTRQLDEARRLHFGPSSERVLDAQPPADRPDGDGAPPEANASPTPESVASTGELTGTSAPPPDPDAAAPASEPEWKEAAPGTPSSTSRKKRKGHGRTRPPADLPRETEILEIPEAERVCPICGKPLRAMGTQDAGQRLEYRRAAVVVIEQKRTTYACQDGTCPQPPQAAPLPVPVIDKGKAEAGMLAFVVVSKFHDHLPLHRIRKILMRHGADVAASTLGGWAARTAEVLEPLYVELIRELLRSKVIGTDDTPVRLMVKPSGKTIEGRIWAYLGDGDHPYAVFEFTPNHRQEAPLRFLDGFEGTVQADAYAGYNKLFATGKVIEAGCNAHARRKFEKALKAKQLLARHAIDTIRALYAIEEEVKDLTADERKAVRQARARPIVERYKAWLEAQQAQVLPKSSLGAAIGYTINQWAALTRYLDDGNVAIDNNAVERILRAVAIGRKNWLFFGSEAGGRLAAILYSVIQSAVLNGVEPMAYVEDVLRRIRTHPRDRMGELLPDRWKASREGAANVTSRGSGEPPPPSPSP